MFALSVMSLFDVERISEVIPVEQFTQPIVIGDHSFPLLVHVGFFVLILPFIRFLLARSLFFPIGNHLLPEGAKNGEIRKGPKQSKEYSSLFEKWEMACWSFTYYFLVTITNFLSMSRQRWFYKPARLFYGCTSIPCEAPMPDPILMMYALQLGFYLQAIPSLIVWDLKRKDFYQMLAHHVATVGLIMYSLGTNFVPMGSMVLLVHDVCDVFMEAAKLCRYINRTQASTVLFGIFVVMWILMRVIYFPIWLIRSAMRDTIGYLAVPYDITPQPHYEFLNGLLIVLYCIHIYWTYLILKIVWSVLVMNQEVDDIREDEEDAKKNL